MGVQVPPFALLSAAAIVIKHGGRIWLIGEADVGVLVVVFTIRQPGSRHRIISAWPANRRERERYAQSKRLSI